MRGNADDDRYGAVVVHGRRQWPRGPCGLHGPRRVHVSRSYSKRLRACRGDRNLFRIGAPLVGAGNAVEEQQYEEPNPSDKRDQADEQPPRTPARIVKPANRDSKRRHEHRQVVECEGCQVAASAVSAKACGVLLPSDRCGRTSLYSRRHARAARRTAPRVSIKHNLGNSWDLRPENRVFAMEPMSGMPGCRMSGCRDVGMSGVRKCGVRLMAVPKELWGVVQHGARSSDHRC